MPWPTVPVVTTGMDADTDTLPRTDILDHAQKFNQLIAMRGLAGGVCDLDASALIPSARLPAVYQPVDATLTALSALATGADQLPYSTGADTFAQTPLTAFARTLLDDADAATARATLGVISAVTGTAPIVSSGGAAPAISIPAATGTVAGHMTAAYAAKLDGIAAGATNGVPKDVGVAGIGSIVEMYVDLVTVASGATVAGSSLYWMINRAATITTTGTWRNITGSSVTNTQTATFQRIA